MPHSQRPDSEVRLRSVLAGAGRRLASAGLVAGIEGNLSGRLDEVTVLVTPAGARKGEMVPEDLVAVEMDTVGLVVRTLPGREGLEPTSELGMHLACYERDGVHAVVHAHPPFATAFAAACRPLDPPLLAEQAAFLGAVPLLPFAVPGTPEVGDGVRTLPEDCRAFLLAGHGATTLGGDVDEALLLMEMLESCARITWHALRLDPEARLSDEELRRLKETRP